MRDSLNRLVLTGMWGAGIHWSERLQLPLFFFVPFAKLVCTRCGFHVAADMPSAFD